MSLAGRLALRSLQAVAVRALFVRALLVAFVVVAAGLALRTAERAVQAADWLDGRDFELYLSATSRWLSGGSFYEPYQLSGAYQLAHGDVLYPPVALIVFVPFTILPAILWWAIPLATIAWAVWRLRPNLLGCALILLCVAWPATVVKLSTGNPVLWIVAAIALGVRLGWPSVLVLVKPTLAPFAIIGVRRRSWWIALGVLVLVALPFAGMWIDWARALVNVRGTGLYYSLAEVPMALIPVIAEVTRTDRRDRRPPAAAGQILSTQ